MTRRSYLPIPTNVPRGRGQGRIVQRDATGLRCAAAAERVCPGRVPTHPPTHPPTRPPHLRCGVCVAHLLWTVKCQGESDVIGRVTHEWRYGTHKMTQTSTPLDFMWAGPHHPHQAHANRTRRQHHIPLGFLWIGLLACRTRHNPPAHPTRHTHQAHPTRHTQALQPLERTATLTLDPITLPSTQSGSASLPRSRPPLAPAGTASTPTT